LKNKFRNFSFDYIKRWLLKQESSKLPELLLGAINKELEEVEEEGLKKEKMPVDDDEESTYASN
jgi:hypothetical protein